MKQRCDDEVLIVGAGFGGIGMGVRLLQSGETRFTIVEREDGVGGTWRVNRYPGAACDIPSHLYSFSFEPRADWSHTYARQPEILEYLERCADKYGLRPHLRLSTSVERAELDQAAGVWRVSLSDGTTRTARVLVAACGGLSRPSLPAIAGLERFGGRVFHSARWDESYALDGKRVAVIGTGASAIQIVPAIAPRVAHLDLYQRTPPWILPRGDHALADEEKERLRRRPSLLRSLRIRQYLRHELYAFGFVVAPRILRWASRMALAHLAAQVADEDLRARLTPDYTMGCKRVLLSNDYYPALTRPHVTLVTDGIREVAEHDVVTTDGTERAVDAIILATGFHAADAIAPFAIVGKGGRTLDDAWQGGAEAYLGITVAGFPNLFFIVGPNSGLGHSSMVFMIESQVAYILDALRVLRERGLRTVDVRPDAQARFNERLAARMTRTVWSTGCVSWYRTPGGRNTTLWPGFTLEYRLRTRRFDARAYALE